MVEMGLTMLSIGRRKGLQQHYLIHIDLMATTSTGEKVKLAEIQSGPIIVRGMLSS